MITYNDIYEALRKERYSEQLQPLPKNFLSEICNYLKDKKNISNKKDDNVFSDAVIKTKKQYENAVFIFKELLLRRKKKLLELAFIAAETGISKRDYENMLSFEKQLFDKIMKAIEDSEKNIADVVNGKQDKEKKSKNILVMFKENTTEFLDLDGSKLGPFKNGDVANLPREIVNILLKDKRVELVEEE